MGGRASIGTDSIRGDIRGRRSHLPGCRLIVDRGRYSCESGCDAGVYSLVPEVIEGHFRIARHPDTQYCMWCQLRGTAGAKATIGCASCKDVYFHDACFHSYHWHLKLLLRHKSTTIDPSAVASLDKPGSPGAAPTAAF